MAAALSAELFDLAMTADAENAEFGLGSAELLEDEAAPQETRVRAFSLAFATPPGVVDDFGDIAVSRPSEDEVSVIEDELVFASF